MYVVLGYDNTMNERKFKAKPGVSKCLSKIDEEINSRDFTDVEKFISKV